MAVGSHGCQIKKQKRTQKTCFYQVKFKMKSKKYVLSQLLTFDLNFRGHSGGLCVTFNKKPNRLAEHAGATPTLTLHDTLCQFFGIFSATARSTTEKTDYSNLFFEIYRRKHDFTVFFYQKTT